MNSLLPSSVPAAELALVRAAGRVAARYAAYPPLSAYRAEDARGVPEAAFAARDTAEGARALALYVHMPFCYSACAFCSCAKIVTRDGGKAMRYLDFLERDIAARAGMLGERRTVARMYWGGGSPTYYTISQLQRVWRALHQHFAFDAGGEYTVEIDPRTVNDAAMAALREMGFTIAGIGVPDLDEAVLEAVGRPQSAQLSLHAVEAARRAGFRTVSVDMMYGLPLQTPGSLTAALRAVAAARPDRVLLHDYVHAPRRHKAQRQIGYRELPRPNDRLEMLGLAVECLGAAGYVHVGADAFVRPGDALVAARAAHRLQYDMLGFSAAGATDIVAAGASAVGATEFAYTQNESDLGAYYERVGGGSSPVARRMMLSPDDVVRRAVMRLLLCEGGVGYAAFEARYSVVFERYFRSEVRALEPYAAAGLLRVDGREIAVAPRGHLWVRNLCSVFDRYREPRRGTRAGVTPIALT
jgi:oxygen-independent coproporphyrinogen III oxidase